MAQASAGTPLAWMVIVVNRGKGEKLSGLLAQHGVVFDLLVLGRGTADSRLLACLGLCETKKDVLFCAMPHALSCALLGALDGELNLKGPGRGIAFSIAIEGAADAASEKRLCGAVRNEEDRTMEQPEIYDLIVAVTNHGYADDVMEAARAAGAPGGTVLHARGVGQQQAEKFFGVTIQPEKEMVMILTKRETRDAIMAAITQRSGLRTEAGTIAFSLPVDGVAGLSF